MAIRLDEVKFCPECGTDNIFYNEKTAEIICQDCGAIFTELTPEQQTKYEQASEILKPIAKKEAKAEKKAKVSKKAKSIKMARPKKQKAKSKKAAKKSKPKKIKKKGFLRFW